MTTSDSEGLKALRDRKVFTLEEACRDMPEVTWYWDTWLPANPMVIFLYGIEGIGKTTVATALLGVFTNGWAFPGTTMGIEHWPRKCYYINADGKNVSLKQKMVDFGVDMSHVLAPVYTYPGTSYLRDPTIRDLEEIISDLEAIKVQEGEDLGLVVLDGFSIFHSQKEIDAQKANEIMTKIRRLANVANAPLLIIHHANKPIRFGKDMPKLHRFRGSTAFSANAELMMMLDQHGDRLKLEVTKSNIGEIPEPIVLSIERDGLRCEGVIPGPSQERSKLDKVTHFLNEVLQKGPMPVHDILEQAEKHCGAKRSTVYEARKRCAIVQYEIGDQHCWALAEPVQKP